MSHGEAGYKSSIPSRYRDRLPTVVLARVGGGNDRVWKRRVSWGNRRKRAVRTTTQLTIGDLSVKQNIHASDSCTAVLFESVSASIARIARWVDGDHVW